MIRSYQGKRVFVTGDKGFKGTWLTRRLEEMGAKVYGFDIEDGHDILSAHQLRAAICAAKPEYLFHLAAQAFVPEGYKDPVGTFMTNTIGTVNVLEALRAYDKPCAAVIVTTDKCYAPGFHGQYHASDPLGGRCPYSSSKAAAEHAVTAYRVGYFEPGHHIRVATARAGNVVGPGDWGEGRLVPNMVRALKAGTPVPVFNPKAVRPWQYVSDVIEGYLLLGAGLAGKDGPAYASAWNFGPDHHYTVEQLVTAFIGEWGTGSWEVVKTALRETDVLAIDSMMTRARLGWRPVYGFERMIHATVQGYRKAVVP